MKRRRIKEPIEEVEKRLQEMRGKHARLLAAYTALREVRSLTHSTEPALVIARDRLKRLPNKFVDRLHLKNPAPLKQLLRREVERIIGDMDSALIEHHDEPVAATYARYLDATSQLKPEDLEKGEQ